MNLETLKVNRVFEHYKYLKNAFTNGKKSVDNPTGYTIKLPTDWMEVAELVNLNNWPLFYSIFFNRIEKERLNLPTAMFQFCFFIFNA